MKLTPVALAGLALSTLFITACAEDGSLDAPALPFGGEEVSFPTFETDRVGKVSIPGDTNRMIRQFSFTDLDGVVQKCFLFGDARGSVTCEAEAPAGENDPTASPTRGTGR